MPTPTPLPEGRITVNKKILEEDITWAHGNPTFLFAVEGYDLMGNYHKYEGEVTFIKGEYELDQEGYASLSYTFAHIPSGSYQVYEKEVLRYCLREITAQTNNVFVVDVNSPASGLPPKEISYAEVDLSEDQSFAELTFYNDKVRFDGYSHTDNITNSIFF